jgi:hypothetical protein
MKNKRKKRQRQSDKKEKKDNRNKYREKGKEKKERTNKKRTQTIPWTKNLNIVASNLFICGYFTTLPVAATVQSRMIL